MPDRPVALTPLLSERDHQRGPAGAPLTLVQFGDYACAFCTEAHPVVEEMRAALKEHLCFAYRHFPVTSPRRSRPAARAAEAAAQQGAFWAMHAALSTEAGAMLSEERLFALAAALAPETGLDLDRFRRDFKDGTGTDRLHADYESARQSGVRGTPSFFLNGRRLDAGRDLDDALAALELDDDVRTAADEHLRRLRTFL